MDHLKPISEACLEADDVSAQPRERFDDQIYDALVPSGDGRLRCPNFRGYLASGHRVGQFELK